VKKEGLGDPYEKRPQATWAFGPGFKESLPNQAHGSGPQPIYEDHWVGLWGCVKAFCKGRKRRSYGRAGPDSWSTNGADGIDDARQQSKVGGLDSCFVARDDEVRPFHLARASKGGVPYWLH
jgi:hypothetical protein